MDSRKFYKFKENDSKWLTTLPSGDNGVGSILEGFLYRLTEEEEERLQALKAPIKVFYSLLEHASLTIYSIPIAIALYTFCSLNL